MKEIQLVGIALALVVAWTSVLCCAADKPFLPLEEETKPIKTFDDGSTLTLEKTVTSNPKDNNRITIAWKAVLVRKDSPIREVVWYDSLETGKARIHDLPYMAVCQMYDAAMKEGSLYLVYLRAADIDVVAVQLAGGKAKTTTTMPVSTASETSNNIPQRAVLLPSESGLQLWLDRSGGIVEFWNMEGKQFKLIWSNSSGWKAASQPTK